MIQFSRDGQGRLGPNGEASVDLNVQFASILEVDQRYRLETLIKAWY